MPEMLISCDRASLHLYAGSLYVMSVNLYISEIITSQ
jgi:hypothetical protein